MSVTTSTANGDGDTAFRRWSFPITGIDPMWAERWSEEARRLFPFLELGHPQSPT